VRPSSFAIPAAKKGGAVFGNDLNPHSAKYMQSNAIDNWVNIPCYTHLISIESRSNLRFVSRVLMDVSSSAMSLMTRGILPFPFSGP
jgi:tRNA G37 N-methylase Trm5